MAQQIPPENATARVDYTVKEVNENVQFFAKTTFLKPNTQVNISTGTPGSELPHGLPEKRREQIDRACQLASDMLTNPVIVIPPEINQQQQQQQPAPFSDCNPT